MGREYGQRLRVRTVKEGVDPIFALAVVAHVEVRHDLLREAVNIGVKGLGTAVAVA